MTVLLADSFTGVGQPLAGRTPDTKGASQWVNTNYDNFAMIPYSANGSAVNNGCHTTGVSRFRAFYPIANNPDIFYCRLVVKNLSYSNAPGDRPAGIKLFGSTSPLVNGLDIGFYLSDYYHPGSEPHGVISLTINPFEGMGLVGFSGYVDVSVNDIDSFIVDISVNGNLLNIAIDDLSVVSNVTITNKKPNNGIVLLGDTMIPAKRYAYIEYGGGVTPDGGGGGGGEIVSDNEGDKHIARSAANFKRSINLFGF